MAAIMKEAMPYTMKVQRVYKASEVKKMGKIVACWVQVFPEDQYPVPDYFLLKDGSPKYAATEDSILRSQIVNKHVKGRLAGDAEELITRILNYQQERRQRGMFRRGRWDDPTMLVLEELKNWAAVRLFNFKCDSPELDEVKRRISYVDALSRDGNIFKSSNKSQVTMRSVLRTIKSVLEEIVVPHINAEIATSSAREHLDRLEVSARLALNHVSLFLFYVLRNTKNTPQATINDILDHVDNSSAVVTARSRFYESLITKSGAMTKLCANQAFALLSESATDEMQKKIEVERRRIEDLPESQALSARVASASPPTSPGKQRPALTTDSKHDGEEDGEDLVVSGGDKEKKKEKKGFFDGIKDKAVALKAAVKEKIVGKKETVDEKNLESVKAAMQRGDLVNMSLEEYAVLQEQNGKQLNIARKEDLQAILQKVMLCPPSGQAKTDCLTACSEFFNHNSGIIKFFRGKPEFLLTFVRLHGWMSELARITHLVAQARMLAGVGGDLLVYGLANEQVNNIMKNFQKLIALIRDDVAVLKKGTSQFFDSLLTSKSHRKDEKVWQEDHHQRSSEFVKDLDNDLNDCATCAAEVIDRANLTTFRERYLQAASQTESFVLGCQNFCSTFGNLVGEPMSPKAVEHKSGPGVEVFKSIMPPSASS